MRVFENVSPVSVQEAIIQKSGMFNRTTHVKIFFQVSVCTINYSREYKSVYYVNISSYTNLSNELYFINIVQVELRGGADLFYTHLGGEGARPVGDGTRGGYNRSRWGGGA